MAAKLLLIALAVTLLFLPASAIDFEVDQFLVKTVINTGESSVQNIKVTNTDTIQGDFVITHVGLNDILSVSEESFSLAPAASKDVSLSFASFVTGTGYAKAGVYTGKINIKSNEELMRVPIIFELQHADVIIDNKFSISPEHSNNIGSGETLPLDVTLINLRGSDSEQVNLRYYIKDLNDKIIFDETESVSFGTSASFTKYIAIPKAESGSYVIGIESDVDGNTGTSSSLIEIKGASNVITEKIEDFLNKHFFVIIIIIAVLSLMITVVATRNVIPKAEAPKRKRN